MKIWELWMTGTVGTGDWQWADRSTPKDTGRLRERTGWAVGQYGYGSGCGLNTGILGLEEKL